MIVPAILEHEAISGLSGQKPGGMRGRASSVVREPESPVDVQKALDSLLQELSAFHRSLGFHGVDPELIIQVFRQVSYFSVMNFNLTNKFSSTPLETVAALLH
jgi:myosin-5